MSARCRAAGPVVLLALILLPGCGAFSSDDVDARVDGPRLLTRAQVERQPVGSPQRTVFEWWRALQFDNALAAKRYYAESVGMTTARLDRQLAFGAGALTLDYRPRLVAVEEDGDRATVDVLLEYKKGNPNGRTDTLQIARAFNLVREGVKWKLAENLYLERRARLAGALIEHAQAQAKDAPARP